MVVVVVLSVIVGYKNEVLRELCRRCRIRSEQRTGIRWNIAHTMFDQETL